MEQLIKPLAAKVTKLEFKPCAPRDKGKELTHISYLLPLHMRTEVCAAPTQEINPIKY